MFVIAESAMTIVRLDGRFDAPQARSLEEMFSMFRPVRHVIIDFARVRDVDDAAVASLARTLGAHAGTRISFRGLSRHVRRLLRYVGLDLDGARDEIRGPADERRVGA